MGFKENNNENTAASLDLSGKANNLSAKNMCNKTHLNEIYVNQKYYRHLTADKRSKSVFKQSQHPLLVQKIF